MEKERKKYKHERKRKIDELLSKINSENEKEYYMPESQINLAMPGKRGYHNIKKELAIRKVRSKGFFVGFWFEGKKWHSFGVFDNIKEATKLYDRLCENGYPKEVRHRIYDFFFLSEDLDCSNASYVFGRLQRTLEKLMDEGLTYIDELRYDRMKTMENVGAKTWWLYGKLLHDGKLGHLMEKGQ